MGQQVSREDSFQPDASAGFAQAGSSGSACGTRNSVSTDAPRENSVVPTVLQWSQGGNSVYVTGSFNAWGERIPMKRSGQDCVVCLNLLPGTYQYKFIVDNEWRFAADQSTVRDEMGNINNLVQVEDQNLFMREEPMSGFFSDNAPNPYTQALPDVITLAKEPPQAPAHLWCLPLNVPTLLEPHTAALSLQTPLSVTLTHLGVHLGSPTLTLGVTRRFRHKFVTIIIYKPHQESCSHEQAAAEAAASVESFRVPALPMRDGWVRGRAPSHGGGGKHANAVSWTDSNSAPGGAQGCHDAYSSAPMDIGSRPASQAAFMELG
eukprot:CAMPEP_0183338512 /NCGR_PEP_ID=MMETSP0164_2-20130417/5776_1 /TAXON_ID=221442 /ORGANISM="Coccolithus pelagicus ssp braarudi, Strain PLY182g" /LENGTH=319 /DNA_ID=CAMNT_0025508373 /DNA_START=45 /DNA_END=1004 /DNA_ORIENTATION=-